MNWGDDGASLEILEAADGAFGVDEQAGRIVLEHGGDLDDGQALGLLEEGVGAVGLADVGLSGGDFGHDEGVGSARDESDVEPFLAEEPASEGLVETAVLRLGDPVELHGT